MFGRAAGLRSRLPRVGAVAALGATGIVAVTTEDKTPQKLSIYPSQPTDTLLLQTPLPLESEIGIARRAITQTYRDGYAQVQGVVSKWIGFEEGVERQVKSLRAPEEPLTPPLLYVGIVTLSSTILTRGRALPIRFLLPPSFFLLSSKYFLPKTTHNVRQYLGEIEDKNFPTLARKHDVSIQHSKMAVDMGKEKWQQSQDKFFIGLGRTIGWLEDNTGLKLREHFGIGWYEQAQLKFLDVTEKADEIIGQAKVEGQKAVDTALAETGKAANTAVVKSSKVVDQVVKGGEQVAKEGGKIVEEVKKRVV